MSDDTPILSLPLILPAQAQKHVTHNEALRLLDILVQLVVRDRGRATPPSAPAEGDCHLIGSGSGEWAGRDGAVAAFWDGGWTYITPRSGWRAWSIAEGRMLTFEAGGWSDGAHQPLEAGQLGINTVSDATNRLALASAASLFTHAGAGHQLKINKASLTETASLLYQNAFSGRAEMGLAGSDSFTIKTSADGSSWSEAARFAPEDGAGDFASGLRIGGALAFHRENILGAVSQSAGVPTGAVIESLGTPNGRLLRWADGTQICSHRLIASAAAPTVWTYPAAFAAPPQVTGSAEAGVLSCLVCDSAPSASSVALSARDGANARRADPMSLLAIGRWS